MKNAKLLKMMQIISGKQKEKTCTDFRVQAIFDAQLCTVNMILYILQYVIYMLHVNTCDI